VERLLEELAAVNPFPQPLELTDVAPIKALWDLRQEGKRGAPEDEAEYGPHLDGPNTPRALAVIRKALARAGMLDASIPERHREYIIEVDPRMAPVVTVGRGLWVVSGELKVRVLVEDENGRSVPVSKGAVELWGMPTQTDERPYLLSTGAIPGKGQPVVFRDMPIGAVEVRTKDKDGSTVEKRAQLTLEHNELTIRLAGEQTDDAAVVADDDETVDDTANVPPLVLTKVSLRRTTITPAGGEDRSQAELQALGASGASRLRNASVDVAVALDVPLRLHPGQRFSMAADMRCRAVTGREPMSVRLTVSPDSRPHDAAITLPAGTSTVRDLKCAVDYTYRYVGQKSYEWNFLYDMRARHGVPRSDRYNERIVKLVIKSDLEPSFEGIELADQGVTQVSGELPRFRRAPNSFVIEAAVEQGGRKLLRLEFDAIYDLAGGATFSAFDLGSAPISGGGGGVDRGLGGGTGGDDRPPYIAPPSPPGGAVTPGDARVQAADPLAVLRSPRPWTDPRVRRAIDSFLSRTKPGVKPREGVPDTWRWTSWGQAVGPGVNAPQAPDSGGMGRHQYLYVQAGSWGSRHHGTLRQYIERFLRGEPTTRATEGGGGLGSLIRGGVPGAGPGEDPQRGDPFVGTWRGTLTTWPKMKDLFGKWTEFRTDQEKRDIEFVITERGDQLNLSTRNFPQHFSGGLMRSGVSTYGPQSTQLKRANPRTITATIRADIPERLADSRTSHPDRLCRSEAILTLALMGGNQLKFTYEGKWWDHIMTLEKPPRPEEPGLIVYGDAVLTGAKSKKK
jgi:hypothetical protein